MAQQINGSDVGGSGAPPSHSKKKRTTSGKSRKRRPGVSSISYHATGSTQEKGGGVKHMNTAVMGIVITIVINIVMASFTYGTVVTRLGHVEDKIKGQEITIKEATKLETKMAVIENQLSQINLSLSRLERNLRPKE